MGSRPSRSFERIISSNNQKDKMDGRHCGCCRRCCLESPVVKPSGCSFHQEGSVFVGTSQFSRWKVLYCCPRAGFHEWTTTQTTPPSNSKLQLAAKAKKKSICQSSYSPNTATADFFLFERGEIRAGRPFAVPGRPHDKLGWGRPPPTFDTRWTVQKVWYVRIGSDWA
jgi:hypothetical protein